MLPSIQGDTAVYLIPGDPVGQVRAPEVFNLIFRTLRINAVLVPVHVPAEDIETFIRAAFLARNIRGMFLAIPHKALVMKLLSSCNDVGRVAGAVNGIRRLADGRIEGGLFDGKGCVAALDYFGIAHAGKKVLLLGAGGGASAIAASLALGAGHAPAEIALYDPTPGKAEAVAAHISSAPEAAGVRVVVAASNDPAGFDLVIHASPLGLKAGDPLPLDVTRLEPHAAVMDILMKNQPTPLLQAVRARGLVAQPGFEMLIQQAPDYLEFFGYADAAAAVRQDATFIREYLYPAAMAAEIREQAPST
ncbi:MAG: shikimate dehydrogenase [Polaromonas sp.]|nr:shikimate dehydrogenase [Polaromonas sp.]